VRSTRASRSADLSQGAPVHSQVSASLLLPPKRTTRSLAAS
jgi:hypothetical protein